MAEAPEAEPSPARRFLATARRELEALRAVEAAARAYAAISHGNLHGEAYRQREEAREQLRDALSHLDSARGLT